MSGPSSPRPARHSGSGPPTPRVVERSAGGVVVRVREGAHHVLLIRDPYRKWGLPKGHLEEGEGSPEAALREVREETGLEDLTLGPELGEIDWTFRARGKVIHKYCRFYLMSAPSGKVHPELAEGITACRWLPMDEAIRTVAYENARQILQRADERLGVASGTGLPWEAEGDPHG